MSTTAGFGCHSGNITQQIPKTMIDINQGWASHRNAQNPKATIKLQQKAHGQNIERHQKPTERNSLAKARTCQKLKLVGREIRYVVMRFKQCSTAPLTLL